LKGAETLFDFYQVLVVAGGGNPRINDAALLLVLRSAA